MVSEIQFLRDQIHARIRSLFMLKSRNGDNDDFSYNSRNIKNTVDNANKNVTPRVFLRVIFKCNPSSAYINFQKFSKDSNIQSNNNYATSADIFNRNNINELTLSPEICINKNIITP